MKSFFAIAGLALAIVFASPAFAIQDDGGGGFSMPTLDLIDANISNVGVDSLGLVPDVFIKLDYGVFAVNPVHVSAIDLMCLVFGGGGKSESEPDPAPPDPPPSGDGSGNVDSASGFCGIQHYYLG